MQGVCKLYVHRAGAAWRKSCGGVTGAGYPGVRMPARQDEEEGGVSSVAVARPTRQVKEWMEWKRWRDEEEEQAAL